MAKKVVLLIEDEASFAEIITEALVKKFFKVQISDNFPEAWSRVNNQAYSAIITDVKLEKGTGTDLVIKTRADPKHPNYKTPIFVMSAAFDEDVVKKIAGKVQGVFVKPFSVEALVSALLAYAK